MGGGEQAAGNDDAPDGFVTWNAYWTAQGMPWRTEPEIGEERLRYLAERRAVQPDSERGIFPFRDEHGGIRLTRADVEWLVATHDMGAPSPDGAGLVLTAAVEPDGSVWRRLGPDLRGADLQGTNLVGMPLEDVQLTGATLRAAHLDRAYLAGAELTEADCASATLRGADLESANLRSARLQDADLTGAHMFQVSLGGADLHRACLREADLGWAFLVDAFLDGADLAGVRLSEAYISGGTLEGIHLDQSAAIQLLGAVLSSGYGDLPHLDWTVFPFVLLDWAQVFELAEEGIQYYQGVQDGRIHMYLPPSTTPEQERIQMCRLVARSYERLAAVWREQGLTALASHLTERAGMLREEVVHSGEDPDAVDAAYTTHGEENGDLSS